MSNQKIETPASQGGSPTRLYLALVVLIASAFLYSCDVVVYDGRPGYPYGAGYQYRLGGRVLDVYNRPVPNVPIMFNMWPTGMGMSSGWHHRRTDRNGYFYFNVKAGHEGIVYINRYIAGAVPNAVIRVTPRDVNLFFATTVLVVKAPAAGRAGGRLIVEMNGAPKRRLGRRDVFELPLGYSHMGSDFVVLNELYDRGDYDGVLRAGPRYMRKYPGLDRNRGDVVTRLLQDSQSRLSKKKRRKKERQIPEAPGVEPPVSGKRGKVAERLLGLMTGQPEAEQQGEVERKDERKRKKVEERERKQTERAEARERERAEKQLEKAERERKRAEKQLEKAEQERKRVAKAEQERERAEKQLEKAEQERARAEKAKERERERAEKAKERERERVAKAEQEKNRLEKLRREEERAELAERQGEKAERAREEKERAEVAQERERAEASRLEAASLERERAERARQEKEHAEVAQERERAERAERARQERARKEAARLEKERAGKAAEERERAEVAMRQREATEAARREKAEEAERAEKKRAELARRKQEQGGGCVSPDRLSSPQAARALKGRCVEFTAELVEQRGTNGGIFRVKGNLVYIEFKRPFQGGVFKGRAKVMGVKNIKGGRGAQGIPLLEALD